MNLFHSRRARTGVARLLLPAAALLACQLAAAAPAHAEAGVLDPSFGSGGKLTTDFAGTYDQANALVIQADGKLVAGGSAVLQQGSTPDFGLTRYNPDGSLDTTFGIGGKVTTDFFGDTDEVHGLAMQADGKIVAAGAAFTGGGSNPDFALVRYNSDGSLDATFGVDGKVTTNFFGHDTAAALVLQADGKLVVGGLTTDNYQMSRGSALARYNPDGSLDTTFGTDGKVIAIGDRVNALAMQADGKLVAAVEVVTGGGYDFGLARYNPDGSLDTTFGTGGGVTTDFNGGADRAYALTVQPDGKLVAAGSTSTATNTDFAIARYSSKGMLDKHFGTGGRVTTDVGGIDEVRALLVQDRKLVVAGTAVVGDSYDFALARYELRGSLDTSFGVGGKVTTDFAGSYDQVNALVIQADGKLVAAGVAVTDPYFGITDFALARYQAL